MRHLNTRLVYLLIFCLARCVFWGDLYGCEGPEGNPQPPMHQLADLVRARKLFAYGELRDYFDHPNCVGYVPNYLCNNSLMHLDG